VPSVILTTSSDGWFQVEARIFTPPTHLALSLYLKRHQFPQRIWRYNVTVSFVPRVLAIDCLCWPLGSTRFLNASMDDKWQQVINGYGSAKQALRCFNSMRDMPV
jgi:hypothetical protein